MRQWVFIALLGFCVPAAVTAAEASPPQATAADPNAAAEGKAVSEVLKLLRSHTDPNLIIGFIRQSPRPYLTSAYDLLALRKAGASEEILDAFSKRGAELRLRAYLDSRQGAAAGPTNEPVILLSSGGRSFDWLSPQPSVQVPHYPFSDALWWWANFYPYPPAPYPALGPYWPGSWHR
jgi:hypothetical protein